MKSGSDPKRALMSALHLALAHLPAAGGGIGTSAMPNTCLIFDTLSTSVHSTPISACSRCAWLSLWSGPDGSIITARSHATSDGDGVSGSDINRAVWAVLAAKVESGRHRAGRDHRRGHDHPPSPSQLRQGTSSSPASCPSSSVAVDISISRSWPKSRPLYGPRQPLDLLGSASYT